MRISFDLIWLLICTAETAHRDCADPFVYVTQAKNDDYLRRVLHQYDGQCISPWYADTMGTFIDTAYTEDGAEYGHELAQAFHQIWTK